MIRLLSCVPVSAEEEVGGCRVQINKIKQEKDDPQRGAFDELRSC
jgi:hypothetical protein